MTAATASTSTPINLVRSSPVLRGPAHYILPALILLVFVFIIPLLIFFWVSFAEFGSLNAFQEEVFATITSPGVVRAILFTLAISAVVSVICVVLAYPLAYILANSKGLVFNLLIATVIVPYFVSAIVRTYAWMVLLGRAGVINQVLLKVGAVANPLQLMYNESAIVLGMTYVLMPYMVMTLFASMKALDRRLLQAAESLGASPTYIFRRIFFPLTLPGVVSGSLIVFILAMGFFITPALMGGPRNVMIAMMIEREVEINLNWPVAAIMSLILLAVTMTLYVFYYRVSNIRQMVS